MIELERRREAAAAAWDLDDAIVLVGAGEPNVLTKATDKFIF